MLDNYYDRQGNPMTIDEAMDKHRDWEYKRVRLAVLPDGKWVSTLWLGLDYSFGEGPPLIFETRVYLSPNDLDDIDCQRYATEADAIRGHEEMVAKWSKGEGVQDGY